MATSERLRYAVKGLHNLLAAAYIGRERLCFAHCCRFVYLVGDPIESAMLVSTFRILDTVFVCVHEVLSRALIKLGSDFLQWLCHPVHHTTMHGFCMCMSMRVLWSRPACSC